MDRTAKNEISKAIVLSKKLARKFLKQRAKGYKAKNWGNYIDTNISHRKNG